MAKQLAFYFDSSSCTGCKACALACKDKNNLPVSVNWRQVTHYVGGSWVTDPDNPSGVIPNNVFSYALSTACMHCQDATCLDVCPSAAFTKNGDGVVIIDAEKCIGCRYCEWACPYGAPQFDNTAGVMTKCNACEDLLALGKKPACVDACVMRALDLDELPVLQAKYGSLTAVEPLPDSGFTRPSFVMTPHRHAQPSGSGTGRILNLERKA